MKVAVVVNSFPVISETFVINHINTLIEAGIQVRVLSYKRNEIYLLHPQYLQNNLDEITTYGVKVPVNKFLRFFAFIKLLFHNFIVDRNFRILKTLNFFKFGKQALNLDLFYKAQVVKTERVYDIIHCHYGPVADDFRKFRELGLITGKLVVSFHGYDFLKKVVLKKYNFYKELFITCDKVVANSFFTKTKLVELGCNPFKIEVLPVVPSHDVVSSHCKNDSEDNARTFKILTVARLEEVKGVRYGIEAVFLLKQIYDVTVQYDIVGGGSLFKDLNQQIELYGMGNSILLHGPKSQDQVFTFYQKADVFLLPSLMETQGLALLEAQITGLPVVATKAGGISENMVENKTGFMVESKDSLGLANALLKLYRSPSLRVSFGKDAKTFVYDKFDSKLTTKKMLAFYKSLISL